MMTYRELMEALQEVAEAENWRLAKSTLTEDYEHYQRKAVLTLVQSSAMQQELDLTGEGQVEGIEK